MTRDEVRSVIQGLHGVYRLMASLMYGSGLSYTLYIKLAVTGSLIAYARNISLLAKLIFLHSIEQLFIGFILQHSLYPIRSTWNPFRYRCTPSNFETHRSGC
ncbi:MAG: hypothetical protein K0S58_2538 [Nitrospira sp.]|jgi:hypothetical protein|nr:hypothetical protein [Nitrospira sp.]